MIKQSATIALTLSLCLAAGCNRGVGNKANASTAANSSGNAVAPAANSANAAAQPKQSGAAIALDSEGLRAVETESGRTSLLAFGQPVAQAITGLNNIFGSSPTADEVNSECGGGAMRIVQWGNGFRILAEGDSFAGWEARGGGPSTMNGIGPGSTWAQLDEAFDPEIEESTLGTEFTIGEGENVMGGLLSADGAAGRIIAIWAGATCHFR